MNIDSKVLFSKVAIRFYNLKKKSSDGVVLLDLLREEIKLIIFITILNQIQQICLNSNATPKQSNEFLIRKILISSKRKILQNLKASHLRCKKKISELTSLRSLIKSENHIIFRLLINYLSTSSHTSSDRVPTQILLEHIVLHLSDILIYDIFLNGTYPSFVIDQWVIDPILFRTYLRKIEIYTRLKVYTTSKRLNGTNNIPDPEFLLVLTESGIVQKKFQVKILSVLPTYTFQSILFTIFFTPVEWVASELHKIVWRMVKN